MTTIRKAKLSGVPRGKRRLPGGGGPELSPKGRAGAQQISRDAGRGRRALPLEAPKMVMAIMSCLAGLVQGLTGFVQPFIHVPDKQSLPTFPVPRPRPGPHNADKNWVRL